MEETRRCIPLHQSRIKKVLDLGCGKGVVSIQLAKEFGFETHGIDAFPPFIKEATKWAKKYGMTSLCTFEVNDIRTRVSELNGYDMAILGSIGPVLGDTEETLNRVKKCIRPNGIIILDDGYIPDGSPHTLEGVNTRMEVIDKIQKCSVKILDEHIYEQSDIEKSNKDIYPGLFMNFRINNCKFSYVNMFIPTPWIPDKRSRERPPPLSFPQFLSGNPPSPCSLIKFMNNPVYKKIEIRAVELIEKHTDKACLFKEYLKAQAEENDVLENQMLCVTWVLQKENDGLGESE